jgi:hypothetical protein
MAFAELLGFAGTPEPEGDQQGCRSGGASGSAALDHRTRYGGYTTHSQKIANACSGNAPTNSTVQRRRGVRDRPG